MISIVLGISFDAASMGTYPVGTGNISSNLFDSIGRLCYSVGNCKKNTEMEI